MIIWYAPSLQWSAVQEPSESGLVSLIVWVVLVFCFCFVLGFGVFFLFDKEFYSLGTHVKSSFLPFFLPSPFSLVGYICCLVVLEQQNTVLCVFRYIISMSFAMVSWCFFLNLKRLSSFGPSSCSSQSVLLIVFALHQAASSSPVSFLRQRVVKILAELGMDSLGPIIYHELWHFSVCITVFMLNFICSSLPFL